MFPDQRKFGQFSEITTWQTSRLSLVSRVSRFPCPPCPPVRAYHLRHFFLSPPGFSRIPLLFNLWFMIFLIISRGFLVRVSMVFSQKVSTSDILPADTSFFGREQAYFQMWISPQYSTIK
ncbi:hypothetical protein BT96DRAFT_202542 [Gymnopus androsaceus JB14]|uniref:Uncharacterized protein n=1 Tax=Gymnopus androsaceus JB14 TaxID=1447944 RepID=A0A6A4H6S4_9AGAR|nr:hypothetical protein BT96DRAFT_202542 [Gymnopus androsaceus JB14]